MVMRIYKFILYGLTNDFWFKSIKPGKCAECSTCKPEIFNRVVKESNGDLVERCYTLLTRSQVRQFARDTNNNIQMNLSFCLPKSFIHVAAAVFDAALSL